MLVSTRGCICDLELGSRKGSGTSQIYGLGLEGEISGFGVRFSGSGLYFWVRVRFRD